MSTNDIYLEKLSKRKETQISDRKKEKPFKFDCYFKIKFEILFGLCDLTNNFVILCLFYHTNIFCCWINVISYLVIVLFFSTFTLIEHFQCITTFKYNSQ